MNILTLQLQGNDININLLIYKKLAYTLKVINHPIRQQILKILDLNKELPVSQIYERLLIEQAVASQHLALLRKINFVYSKRVQKNIYYSINYNAIISFNEKITNIMKEEKEEIVWND